MDYNLYLIAHSHLRWPVWVGGLLAVLFALVARASGKPNKLGNFMEVFYVGLLDLQMVAGVILYFLSPIRAAAYQNISGSLSNEMGFFAFLHPLLMIGAIAAAHIGRAKSKRISDVRKQKSVVFWYFLISFVLLNAGFPWWRPLFRV